MYTSVMVTKSVIRVYRRRTRRQYQRETISPSSQSRWRRLLEDERKFDRFALGGMATYTPVCVDEEPDMVRVAIDDDALAHEVRAWQRFLGRKA